MRAMRRNLILFNLDGAGRAGRTPASEGRWILESNVGVIRVIRRG